MEQELGKALERARANAAVETFRREQVVAFLDNDGGRHA